MKVRIVHIGHKARKILSERGAYNEFSKNIVNKYFEDVTELYGSLEELKIYSSNVAKHYFPDTRAIDNANRKNGVSDDRCFMLNER